MKGPALVCLGIHGQLIYADRAARTVVVKLLSWPDPQHTAYLLDTAARLRQPGRAPGGTRALSRSVRSVLTGRGAS